MKIWKMNDLIGLANVQGGDAPDFIQRMEASILPGTIIPKPMGSEDFVFCGWGVCSGDRAFCYTIPSRKASGKVHQKKIKVDELLLAYAEFCRAGVLTRSWLKANMARIASQGCNFTTIGGILVLLGEAKMERSKIVRIHA